MIEGKITVSDTNFITEEAIQNFVNRQNEFIKLPNYAGCYRLGGNQGLSIYFINKPLWIHRKLMALCLGWEWIDNK